MSSATNDKPTTAMEAAFRQAKKEYEDALKNADAAYDVLCQTYYNWKPDSPYRPEKKHSL